MGGPKGMLAPPPKLLGGGGPGPPAPLFLRLCNCFRPKITLKVSLQYNDNKQHNYFDYGIYEMYMQDAPATSNTSHNEYQKTYLTLEIFFKSRVFWFASVFPSYCIILQNVAKCVFVHFTFSLGFELQSNFNGSNTFGTKKTCSRRG